jgi:ankyrin repeat protein
LSALNKLAPASLSATDKNGLTPAHYAARLGHVACLSALNKLAPASLSATDKNGLTPAHCAALKGHVECLRALNTLAPASLPAKDRSRQTPAHYAARFGHAACLRALSELGAGASLSAKSINGLTPAHLAARFGREACLRALNTLAPASLSAKAINGLTPAHLAALNGHVACLSALNELKIIGDIEFTILGGEGKTNMGTYITKMPGYQVNTAVKMLTKLNKRYDYLLNEEKWRGRKPTNQSTPFPYLPEDIINNITRFLRDKPESLRPIHFLKNTDKFTTKLVKDIIDHTGTHKILGRNRDQNEVKIEFITSLAADNLISYSTVYEIFGKKIYQEIEQINKEDSKSKYLKKNTEANVKAAQYERSKEERSEQQVEIDSLKRQLADLKAVAAADTTDVPSADTTDTSPTSKRLRGASWAAKAEQPEETTKGYSMGM